MDSIQVTLLLTSLKRKKKLSHARSSLPYERPSPVTSKALVFLVRVGRRIALYIEGKNIVEERQKTKLK